MKKISFILALGCIYYNANSYLIAHDNQSSEPMIFDHDEDDDNFGFDSSLDFSQDNLKNYIPVVRTRSIATNIDEWAAGLVILYENGQGGILNQSIYQLTSPIRTRSILDYPFALTYGFDLANQNIFSINFYANVAWPKNFTRSSQFLSSYLNTENQDIIDILQDIAPANNSLDIGQALKLFSPGKVIEMRAGWLLEAHVTRDKWNLNIQLPMQYVARAFYLTPAERDLIFNSQLASLIESSDNINQNQFYFDNFYVDQFGMGDLKLKAMYLLKETPHFDLNVGGFVIFPIATAFQKGIYGTWFEQNNNRAYLDLATINPTQKLTVKNQDDIANFFLAALDKLNSNILYPLLGNNGHAVIAPSCNIDWYFAQNWKFCSDDSFEIPLRSTEQRFYKAIQSTGDFNTQYKTLIDQGTEAEIVLFANQKIQDMFFPFVYNTLVLPGLIVNSTNQFVVSHDHWSMQFGGNYWYQAKEQITAPVALANYDIAVVPCSSASQGKAFGKFSYNFDCQNYNWSLSGYTDITIWNSGIGNDFTIGLSLDCKF